MRKTFVNISIALASLIVSLIAAELAVRLSSSAQYKIQRINERQLFYTRGKQGHCYSSDPRDYFPIDLRQAEHYNKIKKVFDARPALFPLEKLRQYTPHCVLYDHWLRFEGTQPSAERTILAIGDSFTFGEGLRDEDTLTALLGAKRKDLNLINLGKSGFFIDRINSNLRTYLERHPSPAAILYFYNVNDLQMTDAVYKRYRNAGDLQSIRWARLKQLPKLFTESQLVTLAYTAFSIRQQTSRTVENYHDMYFSDENAGPRRKSLIELEKIAAQARGANAELFVLLYPLIYKDFWGHYPFNDVHQFMLEESAKQKISAIDLLPAFENFSSMDELRVHPADFHPNEQANRQVISYLLPILEQRGNNQSSNQKRGKTRTHQMTYEM